MRVLSVIGTRPEAIKMAPIIRALEADNRFSAAVCSTGQHREMLDQVTQFFSIRVDFNLAIMQPGQDLFDVTAAVLLGMRRILREFKPQIILVHGDTSTCFAASLAAFYEGIAVAHVEAGLRTGNMQAPFPEEANRSLVARIAKYHFCPTQQAQLNLLNEGVSANLTQVTGNSVIDALLTAQQLIQKNLTQQDWIDTFGEALVTRITDPENKMVLITGHRRENFGQGFIDICKSIAHLADHNQNTLFVYPVHLNPNVSAPVFQLLSGRHNIALIAPQEYAPFIWLMSNAYLILTDSGGIQEEAPSLNKPVLVMRETTERPEALAAGTIKLVGTNFDEITTAVQRLLENHNDQYARMASAQNPFGDGQTTKRIIEFLVGTTEFKTTEQALT